MPRAELALIIQDASGPGPVGQPAPESVRSEAAAAKAAPEAVRREGAAPKPTTGPAGSGESKAEGGRAKSDAGVQELLQAVAKAIPGVGPLIEFGKMISDLSGRVGSEVKSPRSGSTLSAPPAVKADSGGVAQDVESVANKLRDLGREARAAESGIDRATAALARAGNVSAPPGVQQPEGSDRTTIVAPRVGGAPSLPAPPVTRVPTGAPVLPSPAPTGGPAGAVTGTAALSRLAGPIGIAVVGLTAVGYAANKAGDALDRQARELAQWSMDLAASTARADIRAQRMEMERARTIGPELARFQDNWSKLDANVSRLGTMFQKAALEVINPMGDLAVKITTAITDSAELAQANANLIIAALSGNKEEQEKAREELTRIRQRIEEPEENFGDEDFEQALFAPIGGLARRIPPRPPRPQGAGRGDNPLPPEGGMF